MLSSSYSTFRQQIQITILKKKTKQIWLRSTLSLELLLGIQQQFPED